MRALHGLLIACLGVCAPSAAAAGSFCAGDRARLGQVLGGTLARAVHALDQLERSAVQASTGLGSVATDLIAWDSYLQSRAALLTSLLEPSPTPAAEEAIAIPWARAAQLRHELVGSASARPLELAQNAARQARFTLAICQALKTGKREACAPLGDQAVPAFATCDFLRRSIHLLGERCRTPRIRALLAAHERLYQACAGMCEACAPVCGRLFFPLVDWTFGLCRSIASGEADGCQLPVPGCSRAEACLSSQVLDAYLHGQSTEEDLRRAVPDQELWPAVRAARSPGPACLRAALQVFDERSRRFFQLDFPFAAPSLRIGW
jgi:hypothetical protein